MTGVGWSGEEGTLTIVRADFGERDASRDREDITSSEQHTLAWESSAEPMNGLVLMASEQRQVNSKD